jgi:plasmid stability protein
MANLSIKNLADELYSKLQARAKRNHHSVAQEVSHILSEALEKQEPLSILDLKGLGKDLWKNIKASEHVERERKAWD